MRRRVKRKKLGDRERKVETNGGSEKERKEERSSDVQRFGDV